MCDPSVSRNVGLRSEPSLEKTMAWINRMFQDSSIRAWAVMLEGRHVGNVILDQIDLYLNTARVSVYVGMPEQRASGIGRTAVYLAAQRGFGEMGLNKIWATIHVNNIASIRMFNSLGFRVEGILRDEFWLEEQRVDVFYMGLLRGESTNVIR
jgi:RimJ/RimL family protein N-acetyltransferase